MSAGTLLAGALVAVGLVGVVVPVLPGSALIALGVLVWALAERSVTAWVVLGVVLVLLAAGQVLSYLLAGRSLVAAGVPRRSLLAAALGALVGFFVVPVLGLLLGGVVGLYLGEVARLGPGARSWRSTWLALRAIAIQVGVELAAALAAAGTWLWGVWRS
ncbi:DUF456 family protein [Quadrisphaera sp. DSM 44207]|uniref:DUF456 family protein n=1 Tax=Quadrisphaera sp. DSM 44207 TaxID=1881057 RepID=UPI0008820EBA|nr:DUF456 family protein [Quadrisphaera sp. DSM 44207]SDQ50650.1 hypothetical protein SAMN05428996_1969 [Quadrisphaera sp. DSM 44207]